MTTNVKRKKHKFSLPSAFLIIIMIMLLFIGISWITYAAGVKTQTWVPAVLDNLSKVIKGEEGHYEDVALKGLGFLDVMTAIWHGFESKATTILFILCIGGTLGIMTKTKAIDAGIAVVVKRLKGKEIYMIPILMIIFGLGGTTYGMWEETIAFFPILIPVFIKVGYGPITAVFVILLGAGAGNLGSTVNPFATGVAFESAKKAVNGFNEAAAATTQSVFFGARWLMFVVFEAVAIGFVVFTALRIKSGKKVIKGIDNDKIKKDFIKNEGDIKFTKRRKFILTLFVTGFLIMIVSYLPWSEWIPKQQLVNLNKGWSTAMFWVASIDGQWAPWGLVSVSGVFLLISIFALFINRDDFVESGKTRENVFINTFIDGAKDVLSVCLLIATAAGLGTILASSNIGLWIANSVKGLGTAGLLGFGVVIFILSLVLSFLLPSTSGFAAAFIPIFAQIAWTAFGDPSGTGHPTVQNLTNYKAALGLIMFAFLFAEGIVNICSPTSAALMAYTKLAHVPYNVWLKETAPLTIGFTGLSLTFMIIFGAICQFGGGALF